MVSHRVKFQRYYDLPERVLDRSHSFTLDKSIDDFRRWTIERGLRHIGIGTEQSCRRLLPPVQARCRAHPG